MRESAPRITPEEKVMAMLVREGALEMGGKREEGAGVTLMFLGWRNGGC